MLPEGLPANTLLANMKREFIHCVFETVALCYPEVEAVAHNNQFITYKALNERANYVAAHLVDAGIKPGEIVGVKLDKGIDLIVSILAVMKAGAAYLPIDSTYPEGRINYMLEDSQIKLLLTSTQYAAQHQGVLKVIVGDLQGSLASNVLVPTAPDSLAYLIYTSGTTGNPKGVMVGHAGFVNMCRHQILTFELEAGERVLQFASISFDASVYEIFITLLSGATLVIVDKETILDRKLFLNYLDEQRLSFILLPPVYLNSLARPEFNTVKTIVTAGEACNVADALHYSRTKKYFNAYGPTEASVCVSLYQVLPGHSYANYVPIGKAIPAVTFYVLDEDLTPVKEGEEGELYIGGIGLAHGYLNRPTLTRKAFIEAPNPVGERIYRTGDIVKQLADGNLITLGRKDNQIKILGNRIELGAISHALLQTPAISNAHVCALEHEGEKYLCAYFTSPEVILGQELRERLLEELPSFMVPHWFIQLPEFKMTSNGKIDTKALPSPFDLNDPKEKDETTPRTTEERLLEIGKDVLGIRRLSLTDNFFLMGGHSLKAAKLAAKICKVFHVNLSVSALYKKPYFTDMLAYIETTQKSAYETITPVSVKKYYATSAAQKRMFVMSSTDKVDVSYNVSIVLQFENPIAQSEIVRVLKVLSDRHEVLRTRFSMQADELVQEVVPAVEINLLYGGTIDTTELSGCAKKLVRPFDLSIAPIFKAGYFEINRGGVAIVFDTHHIIADGTSMGILVNEFVRLLQQKSLPEIQLQYRDYAEWEILQHARGDYFKKHEQYWLNMHQEIPRLKMPADRTGGGNPSFAGERLSFTIGSEAALKIKQFALEADVSLYQLLLSVYYLLLSKYTHQQDLVVGTAVANRKKEEVQQMMGMFVNTLALRAWVPAEASFSTFVQDIKNLVLEAFEYQEYPFELLVSRLGLSGNANKVPLIDTLFIVQNIDFFSDQAIDGLSMKYENATATSKFDFSFFIVEQADAFVLEVEFNTGMFSNQYISALAKDFINLAYKAVCTPSAMLEEISLVDNEKLSGIRALLNTESAMADVEFDL